MAADRAALTAILTGGRLIDMRTKQGRADRQTDIAGIILSVV